MERNSKKRLTFKTFITELAARKECARIMAGYSRFMKKKHPASVTPWEGSDGSRAWIVWFHY